MTTDNNSSSDLDLEGDVSEQSSRYPLLHECADGVAVSSSVFRLLLSQRLLSGKHIVENAKGAQKYFTDRKIGEKSEVHHFAHLGRKTSTGVLRTSQLLGCLEKSLMEVKKKQKSTSGNEIKIVVAFASPEMCDKLLDHEDVIGSDNE